MRSGNQSAIQPSLLRAASVSIVLACVLLVLEARAIWGTRAPATVALSFGAIAMYAILSLWIANLRVGRFQALFAFAVGFGIAALSVPLALFPDGLTLLAHEVRPGLAPMEQVGLVVVAGYFLALAIGLGLAGGTWFGAMIFAGGLAASWSDKRAKPLALGTMFGGWLVISGAALVFQLTEPDYTFFPKGIAFFWGAVLTLSCLGLLWVTLALVLRTKW